MLLCCRKVLDIFDPKQTLKNPSPTHDMAILSIGQKNVVATYLAREEEANIWLFSQYS